MKALANGVVRLVALSLALGVVACGPSDDPEIVAIQYLRATGSGDPDTAVHLLDIERVAERVEEQIVVLDTTGRESFLEDSIETLLWGLFRETRPKQFSYSATPAELDGDTAQVVVSKSDADGKVEEVVVYLRQTDAGWRVSGTSLDRLVTFVVQRLEERY